MSQVQRTDLQLNGPNAKKKVTSKAQGAAGISKEGGTDE